MGLILARRADKDEKAFRTKSRFLRLEASDTVITAETLAQLRFFLERTGELRAKEIPYLPGYNARELFHCRLRSTHSASLSGVGFLTVYAQEEAVISNGRLEYAFSGLSKDGKYYVVAHLPVYVKRDLNDSWCRDFDRIASSWSYPDWPEYRLYLDRVVRVLESMPAEVFDPDLDRIQIFLQSLDLRRAKF